MSLLNKKYKNFEDNKINKESNYNSKQFVYIPYTIKKSSTSEEHSFPLSNLEEKYISNSGWISAKYCKYPQKMIIKFNNYVNIRQIFVLINENKIPTKIEFINCLESEETKEKYIYENIGYIKLSSNEDTNYEKREFRKIQINAKVTNRIKILLYENYKNTFNEYNQVGLLSLEFYGNIIENNNNIKSNIINDEVKNESYEINEEQETKKGKKIEGNKKKIIKYKEKFEDRNNKKIKKNIKKIKLIKFEDNQDENENINNNLIINKDSNISDRNNNNSNKKIKSINKINNMFVLNCNKKDRKNNNNILIEDIKKILKENENEIYNQEDKKFKNLQNQIDDIKNVLNKIYYVGKQANNKTIKVENKETNRVKYLKLKTFNHNNKLSIANKRKINSFNPLTRNNSLPYPLINNNINKNCLKIGHVIKNPLNLKNLSFEDLPILSIRKKYNNYNSENENENNKGFDSLNESYDDISIENNSLDELSLDIMEKYDCLINLLGDDIFKKLFSNNIFKQEEGLNFFIEKANEIIINKPTNIEDANKYIISLFNIIIIFIDDKHPILIMKCLELFIKILKAIEEKSNINKKEYNFKISKPIIIKIKNKLNNTSKRIRQKAFDLYCKILESKICDFYSLVSDLIEEETKEYYYKVNIFNNGDYKLKINTINEMNFNSKNLKIELNKNLIIIKMNILLRIFINHENKIKRFNVNKFPKKLVGDYIVMNIGNIKEEVREITKSVLAKYINIFGNEIFYKLKLVLGNRELTKIIQDKDELLQEMNKYEINRLQKLKESKLLLNKMKSYNKLPHLSPLKICINNNIIESNNYYSPTSKSNQNINVINSLNQPKNSINNKNIS